MATVLDSNSAEMNVKLVLTLLRWGIGALFIYAGALKAWDTQQFAVDLQHYALTKSGDLILITAIYLPWVEIAAGLSLVTRRWHVGGLVALLALDVIFIAVLSSAWWRGLDITCGCFGREENLTNFPLLILRDLALFGALFVLLIAEWRDFRSRRGMSVPVHEP
jgi:hypothetical protein